MSTDETGDFPSTLRTSPLVMGVVVPAPGQATDPREGKPPILAPSPTLRTYEQGVADGRAAAAAEARACTKCSCPTFNYDVGEHPGICNCRHSDTAHNVGSLQAVGDACAAAVAEVDQLRRDLADAVQVRNDRWERNKKAERARGEAEAERDRVRGRYVEAAERLVEITAERDDLLAALQPTERNLDALRRVWDEWHPRTTSVRELMASVLRALQWRPAVRNLEAAEVNHGPRDEGAQAQPAGAAAAPTGQAGGEQSSPAGPPAGLRPDGYCSLPANHEGPCDPPQGRVAFSPAATVHVDPPPAEPSSPLVSRFWKRGDGHLLLLVPGGITPEDLRAQGFPDVAARLEGKPAYEPPRAIEPQGGLCCRWHASGGSREAACSDGAARPYSPRGP